MINASNPKVQSAVTIIFVTIGLLAAQRNPANAIEQVASALDKINTYSYRHEFVSVSQKNTGRTVRQVSDGKWQSKPMGLHATTRIEETLNTNSPNPGKPKVIVDLVETHRAGGRGIIVDHMKNCLLYTSDAADE